MGCSVLQAYKTWSWSFVFKDFSIEISNTLKLNVYQAHIERDTAIQKLQNLLRNNYIDVRRVFPAIHTSLINF